jgi:hypothetical protein
MAQNIQHPKGLDSMPHVRIEGGFGKDAVSMPSSPDEEIGPDRLSEAPAQAPDGLMHLVQVGPWLAPDLLEENPAGCELPGTRREVRRKVEKERGHDDLLTSPAKEPGCHVDCQGPGNDRSPSAQPSAMNEPFQLEGHLIRIEHGGDRIQTTGFECPGPSVWIVADGHDRMSLATKLPKQYAGPLDAEVQDGESGRHAPGPEERLAGGGRLDSRQVPRLDRADDLSGPCPVPSDHEHDSRSSKGRIPLCVWRLFPSGGVPGHDLATFV